AWGRTELWTGHFGGAARVFARILDRVEKEAVDFHSKAHGVHPVVATLAQGAVAFGVTAARITRAPTPSADSPRPTRARGCLRRRLCPLPRRVRRARLRKR